MDLPRSYPHSGRDPECFRSKLENRIPLWIDRALSKGTAIRSPLLARRVDGIFISDFEQGEIGPDLFQHACMMGLIEGMVNIAAARRMAPAGTVRSEEARRIIEEYANSLREIIKKLSRHFQH